MLDCITCGSKEIDMNNLRYFVFSGLVVVPNTYALCNIHKHLTYKFDDIYDENSKRKIIDHYTVIERYNKANNIND